MRKLIHRWTQPFFNFQKRVGKNIPWVPQHTLPFIIGVYEHFCTRTFSGKCYYSDIHDKNPCKLSAKAFQKSFKTHLTCI